MKACTEVLIRPASPSDARAVAQFQTACWREAYRGLVPQDYLDRVTAADREVRWRERLAGQRQVAVATGVREAEAAEAAGGLRGVVSWATGVEPGLPALELKSLYVAADHRGTGLAARLVEVAVGAQPAHLWVFAGNARAQRFYLRLGFAADGTQAGDPDTGLTMSRLVRGFCGSR